MDPFIELERISFTIPLGHLQDENARLIDRL